MGKFRYIWRGYVRGMIQHYPENKKLIAEQQKQRTVSNYGGLGVRGSGGVKRVTESVLALGTVSKEVDAVSKAWDAAGDQEQEFVRLYYWSNCKYNLEGVALRLYVSPRTVRRIHNQFILRVAKNFGLLEV